MLYVCLRGVMEGCIVCSCYDAWSCRCSSVSSMSVSACICCMIVSCVHSVAVINTTFYNLLMVVKDARGDHMEEAYSRAGFMTVL